MSLVISSISKAIASLRKPKILLLLFVPPFIALTGLLVLFAVFWQAWLASMGTFLNETWLLQWLQSFTEISVLGQWIAGIFLVLIFIPLAYMLSVLITATFVLPVVLHILGKDVYPALQKKNGGSTAGSVWNSVKVSLQFLFLFFVTLPLWLIPGLQIVVPLLLSAWLNKKVFIYDVLEQYASREERLQIESEESSALYGMGVLLGLFAYIPFVFVLIPVLSALSYSYYGLSALERLRK